MLVGLADVDQDGALVEQALRAAAASMVGRDMTVSFPARSVLAIETVQGREQALDPRIGDPVPERLGVAAEGHDAFLAHAREVLRQRRLRQADVFGQCADRRLPVLHELAEDEQPPVVGERRQDRSATSPALASRARGSIYTAERSQLYRAK